ncbi:MAG: hypothetical protein KatS3mg009_1701 [Acidimicrobiia bacterium]|nr:MAG: hypothetical protein KatS3mg009_1701 [Acidimicrobiia bacterium]
MRDVERVCERVILLAHGRVVATGRPDEIAAHYGANDLEAAFLELAQRQRREAVHAQQSDHP